ncbi:antitoxin BrnA [Candidatus Termititenax aidoneus]|uniref:Antitoxin BrnA n=1 Tax=Termititenax aidoneus TaxID=2218524 RepID=A0A388TDM4_TERA1|nr:antitoxin BrnA [Candidatus Termititenax aidoneus]
MVMVRKTIKEMLQAKSRTNWEYVKNLKDKDIQDAEGDFEGGRRVHIRMGRPQKEITRQLASIRIPAPALVKLRSLGKGWSTIAGDVLANWINKKPLKQAA